MGFDGVFAAIPYYLGILRACAEEFRSGRPDVCVVVDSPALHVPLARIAKRYRLPVVHFVTPQFWAWGPWRAPAYARVVDLALTILPFEPDWFGRRGVRTAHVGHPLLDELRDVPATRPPRGSRVMAILPGSREAVIERNLPWMLKIAARMRRDVEGLEVVIVQQEDRFEQRFRHHVRAAGAEAWARVETGDLHGSLSRVACAFTVSGTILLDLLHHRLPTVVVYRVGRRRDAGHLIARREVLPEFSFTGEGPVDRVREALLRCFNDPDWIQQTRHGLDLAAARLGPPGACERAAGHVLATVRGPEDAS
jgi:lipid-A-disaccharide synthase